MAHRTLLVVASNPPLHTSGKRTFSRVDQARQALEFAEARLVNLFALPTYRSDNLGDLGCKTDGWLAARGAIRQGLCEADGVLLAYGVQRPLGDARRHHQEQTAWLSDALRQHAVDRWWVGGAPRHPSRWQRYTSRAHTNLPFTQGLSLALATLSADDVASLASRR